MISLIGSLADNKSALGRRYGEWAVSAPTIESAVAAAAMAQDELGHARRPTRCWPSWASSARDEGLDAGQPLSDPGAGAPRLGVVDRRQPRNRRHPDDVRRERTRQHDRAARPAGPEDPPGGGRPPRPRRGVAEADLPHRRRGRRAATPAHRRNVERGRSVARPRRRSRLPGGDRERMVSAGPGRRSAAASGIGCRSCWSRRTPDWSSRIRPTGRHWDGTRRQ